MDYDKDLVKKYWKMYCETVSPSKKAELLQNMPEDNWSFGDSPKMADDLLGYVLRGEKTSTSGMVLDFENDGEKIPEIGDRSIILNGKKEPACIIEMVDVQVKKFKEVDEVFALKEGEGFKSLQDWRDVHWDFFTRRSKVLGIELTEDVEVVCLEFKVIFK